MQGCRWEPRFRISLSLSIAVWRKSLRRPQLSNANLALHSKLPSEMAPFARTLGVGRNRDQQSSRAYRCSDDQLGRAPATYAVARRSPPLQTLARRAARPSIKVSMNCCGFCNGLVELSCLQATQNRNQDDRKKDTGRNHCNSIAFAVIEAVARVSGSASGSIRCLISRHPSRIGGPDGRNPAPCPSRKM
jgi:hypothetical protein